RSSTSFYSTDPAPSAIYTLSLHDALPISLLLAHEVKHVGEPAILVLVQHHAAFPAGMEQVVVSLRQLVTLHPFRVIGHNDQVIRSEEHTSELQSRFDLVCRLLLEKKKYNK